MIERTLIVIGLAAVLGVGYAVLRRVQVWRAARQAPADPLLAAFQPGIPGVVYFTSPQCAPCHPVTIDGENFAWHARWQFEKVVRKMFVAADDDGSGTLDHHEVLSLFEDKGNLEVSAPHAIRCHPHLNLAAAPLFCTPAVVGVSCRISDPLGFPTTAPPLVNRLSSRRFRPSTLPWSMANSSPATTSMATAASISRSLLACFMTKLRLRVSTTSWMPTVMVASQEVSSRRT